MTPPAPQRLLLRLDTGRPCSLRAGHDHTASGERIHVTHIDIIALGHLTHDHARALGHKGTAAFKRDWITRRDTKWLQTADRTEAELLARFAAHWAHRHAWLIRYHAAEAPRYLASQRDVLTGRTSDSDGHADYVSSRGRSIDPDAECIDADTQDRYAKDALGFCLGRQMARAKQLERDQARREGERRPYPRAA